MNRSKIMPHELSIAEQDHTDLVIAVEDYIVTLQRFDEDIDPEAGATYHGFYILLTINGIDIKACKYDYEDSISIANELDENDKEAIEAIRRIARRFFNVTKIILQRAQKEV